MVFDFTNYLFQGGDHVVLTSRKNLYQEAMMWHLTSCSIYFTEVMMWHMTL